MALSPGSSLATYRILGSLGAGAMGEVYRAVDTRLDREVAIKVLPEHFATDEDRLKRFEREAKTLASLNHPGVAQIFGVDQVGETCFLVLELVPGESLEARLKQGPLPLDETVDSCRQIADGLEAAHEAGVIHRDLKPANVLLTPDGKVKVLDFGLAKPAREGRASSTDSVLSTEAGRLLGTPTYMAPEQARGKPIDRRVDVWAFGCVLYECLAGESAFQGETLSDVLAAVLGKEPDWTKLPASTPPRLRDLIARCLVKDARRRLRDIGDARLELERGYAADADSPSGARRPSKIARALPWIAAAVLAGLWIVSALRSRAAPAPESPRHLSVRLPHGLELPGFGDVTQNQVLAISPDGRRVAFVGEEDGPRRIYLRSLDSASVVAVPGSEDAQCPMFSPDSAWVAFGARGKLWKSAMGAGQPIEIAAVFPDRGGAWGKDGSIVVAPTKTSGLVRIPPGGGAAAELTVPDQSGGERSHRWPAFLPGGDEVAFTVGRVESPGNYDEASIEAVSISTGKRRKLLQGASYVRGIEPDGLVFGRAGKLFVMPMAAAAGGALGAAVPVMETVAGMPMSGVVYFDVSDDGTLVYAERDPRENEFELAWLAPDGKLTGADLPVREYRTPRISPDGKKVVVAIGPGGGGESDLWVIDLEKRTLSRLTFDKHSSSPSWSGDGGKILFLTADGGRKSAFATKRADGSGDVEKLAEFEEALPRFPLGFTGDGAGILYMTQGTAGSTQDVSLWDLKEGKASGVLTSLASEQFLTLSPDGKWIAYVSDESGTREVYVQDFPGKKGKWQIGEGATAVRWGRDGRELIVVQGMKLIAVPVETGGRFESGEGKVVAEIEFVPMDESAANYDVGADGRVLVVRPTSVGEWRGHVEVILDWSARHPVTR